MRTDFIGSPASRQLNFNANSTSAWGNTRMRVAMVLDNTRVDGRERQDGGHANRRQRHDRRRCPATISRPATSIFPSFRSRRTSTSASPMSTRPGSTGPTGRPSLRILRSSKYNSPNSGSTSAGSCGIGSALSTKQRTTWLHLYGSARNVEWRSSTATEWYDPLERHLCRLHLPQRRQRQQTSRQNRASTTTVATRAVDRRERSDAALRDSTHVVRCTGSGTSQICHYWRGDGTAGDGEACGPRHSTWTGCINDRDQDYDTKNDRTGLSNQARPRSSTQSSGRTAFPPR